MRAGEQGRCALYFGGFACFCIEFKETNVSRKLIKERRRLLTIYFFSYCLFFIIIIVIHTQLMLQSQIINVLPRRIVATLWASQETRVSVSFFFLPCTVKLNYTLQWVHGTNKLHFLNSCQLSHFYRKQHQQRAAEEPPATTPAFLRSELPLRYAHLLRLLSTLSPEALQTPIIRHVAHRYLYDLCTLLHPSLGGTSRRAFADVLRRIRHRQAASLIRLRYALSSVSPALLDNLNTVGLGIHMLLGKALQAPLVSWHILLSYAILFYRINSDQHLAEHAERVQMLCPIAVAQQAATDAREACKSALGRQVPEIHVEAYQRKKQDVRLTFMPTLLHRVLYETMLLTLRAQMAQADPVQSKWSSWLPSLRSHWSRDSDKITLSVFGGPTSVGFRLTTPAPLLASDLRPDIPRNPAGIPASHGILSHTQPDTLQDDTIPDVNWYAWSGWSAAKVMASHWGGNLDQVTADGLGSTIYLALDRDTTLQERYPSKRTLGCSAYHLLRHHRRMSAAAVAAAVNSPLTHAAAEDQLDAFLDAISTKETWSPTRRDEIYHSVSTTAAVAAAVGHA